MEVKVQISMCLWKQLCQLQNGTLVEPVLFVLFEWITGFYQECQNPLHLVVT